MKNLNINDKKRYEHILSIFKKLEQEAVKKENYEIAVYYRDMINKDTIKQI